MICKKCGIEKSLDDFAKDSGTFIGRAEQCKECVAKRNRNARRTRIGLASSMWGHQNSSSVRRGHVMPNYSKDEFTLWLFRIPEFPYMYDKWVDSDYNKQLTPSTDRLDDSKPYSLDNIRIIAWGKHHAVTCHRRKTGIDNTVNKAIKQFSKDGEFIKEYFSIKEAERKTGVRNSSISTVAKGKRKTAGGFVWKYA